MYKIALISYHKNAEVIYPAEWVIQHRESILAQTYKGFDVLELEYGGGGFRVFENSIYESFPLPTFVDAMNYLLEKAVRMGYKCVGNLNLDDWYASGRVRVQVEHIKNGVDLVSSNFSLMKDGVMIHKHRFEGLDIKTELNRNHNIVAHPVVMMSARFIENNKYVPDEVPYEDMLLWKRTIDNYRFIIAPENLLFQRIHSNSVCQSLNR